MKIAVIGGGASGFMAAITAKKNNLNARVTIYEKTDKVLSKVRISGGGRCNVTNATFSVSQLVKNYPRGGKQLKKSFNLFNTNHIIKWFEEKGIKLKTEADNRMFPASNTSETIVNCLVETAESLKVRLSYKSKVTAINPTHKGIELDMNEQKLLFDKVIIASGGTPKKEGLNWLENIGYQIVNPVPSLFTFNLANKDICKLMGLSISKAIATIKGSKLKQKGAMLITHWGLSGPSILKLSSWGAEKLAKRNYNFTVGVNWLAINEEELRVQFSTITESRKLIHKHNPFDVPKRLWKFILDKLDISDSQIWGELTKKNKNRLINTLINDAFEVRGKTTFKEEFVSCGGINLFDINMNTMESKLHKGVYFAGEILNIDGVTGGFNFQAAWTTGYLAGKNSAI